MLTEKRTSALTLFPTWFCTCSLESPVHCVMLTEKREENQCFDSLLHLVLHMFHGESCTLCSANREENLCFDSYLHLILGRFLGESYTLCNANGKENLCFDSCLHLILRRFLGESCTLCNANDEESREPVFCLFSTWPWAGSLESCIHREENLCFDSVLHLVLHRCSPPCPAQVL